MNLPGSIHPAYPEDKCEKHPQVNATVNVQGETDSFGCELHPMCEACYEEHKAQPPNKNIGDCDWCKTKDVERKFIRDYDEGFCGPVYLVCETCRRKRDEDAAKEFEEFKNQKMFAEEEDWEEAANGEVEMEGDWE